MIEYLKKTKKTLENIKVPVEVYNGPTIKATKLFPQNINVSAALSLAGIGPTKTYVRIIADPTVDKNIHQIEVIGDFGKITTRTENLPAKANPKTSYLAILSAIATLKEITG
jgi:aspartate dehydrogenase